MIEACSIDLCFVYTGIPCNHVEKKIPFKWTIKQINSNQMEHAALRYEADTMQRTFLQTLHTGLEEGLRHEEGPHVSDEDLLKGINVAMVMTSKRKEKQVKHSSTSAVRSEEAQQTEISVLARGLAILQATVGSLQEKITKSNTLGKEEARPPTNQWPRRERGCEACPEAGRGDSSVTTATGAGEKTT